MSKKVYWAGFCDGKICWNLEHFGDCKDHDVMPAIYIRRKDAKKHYQDVRKVKILEVKK